MTLQDTLNQIQADLDKREVSIAERVQVVLAREQGVNAKADLLEHKEVDLNTREANVAQRELVVLAADAQDSRIQELKALESSTAQDRIDIDKRERGLAEMLATISQREEKVIERELAVSEREENYKEKLQKEFFEGIRKSLPQ